MAELKTKRTAASVKAFLDAKVVDESCRADCETLLLLMNKATGEKPTMWGTSIIGFGKYAYKYESGQKGEWPIVGFSPRKTDLTIYIMPGLHRFPEHLRSLGKHKTGKSCLYIRKLADVDVEVLTKMIEDSVKEMDKHRVR
jgi:hypothetical protein